MNFVGPREPRVNVQHLAKGLDRRCVTLRTCCRSRGSARRDDLPPSAANTLIPRGEKTTLRVPADAQRRGKRRGITPPPSFPPPPAPAIFHKQVCSDELGHVTNTTSFPSLTPPFFFCCRAQGESLAGYVNVKRTVALFAAGCGVRQRRQHSERRWVTLAEQNSSYERVVSSLMYFNGLTTVIITRDNKDGDAGEGNAFCSAQNVKIVAVFRFDNK